ncbi:unnamed protein product [Pleuronectes platessa]|uniref:Uncharacterized protein n=1 Tax=Pleuronectes platessa TaxID=8262 RepID=A0A9N7YX86_PLEPL|nr:unnamed protein product [Pleuronectes platessa]
MAWRSFVPIAFVTAQKSVAPWVKTLAGTDICPPLSGAESLHRRSPLRGLTHALGARADSVVSLTMVTEIRRRRSCKELVEVSLGKGRVGAGKKTTSTRAFFHTLSTLIIISCPPAAPCKEHKKKNKKKKSPQPRSRPDQSVARIRKQTFKENEMPPLIGHTALVFPAQSSNRYLRDKQPSATDIESSHTVFEVNVLDTCAFVFDTREFHPLSVSPWAGLPLPLLTKRCEEEEEEKEEVE